MQPTRPSGADVHAWAHAHRFEPLKHAQLLRAVFATSCRRFARARLRSRRARPHMPRAARCTRRCDGRRRAASSRCGAAVPSLRGSQRAPRGRRRQRPRRAPPPRPRPRAAKRLRQQCGPPGGRRHAAAAAAAPPSANIGPGASMRVRGARGEGGGGGGGKGRRALPLWHCLPHPTPLVPRPPHTESAQIKIKITRRAGRPLRPCAHTRSDP